MAGPCCLRHSPCLRTTTWVGLARAAAGRWRCATSPSQQGVVPNTTKYSEIAKAKSVDELLTREDAIIEAARQLLPGD